MKVNIKFVLVFVKLIRIFIALDREDFIIMISN